MKAAIVTEGARDYDTTTFAIGLSLAISSSIFIGSSFIVKKLALRKVSTNGGLRASAGGFAYLKQWMWWLGLITMGVGEAANLLAYAFAPAALVTPLGALSVLVAAVLASKCINEKLNFIGKIGCFLCIIGSIIFVIHSPKTEEIQTFKELLRMLWNPYKTTQYA
ncbi:magnesium transporter NIPA2 isoform X2 [Manduca sexta]|uniref:magnesium transporter NIPA2 isoform X2 n=1 Tax=Manduca sexta TaxID=7130 RepID=UPI001182F691|nr:magnesium transporter NIPA2 isoform X2 [Manduca sexta]